jgi:hypothetical protein
MPSKLAGTKEDLGDLFYVEDRDIGETSVAKSLRLVGQETEGVKCPQKSLQSLILRSSTGFEQR